MFHQIQSRPYGLTDRARLFNIAKGNVDFMQRLTIDKKLEIHNGCVNTICWNRTGTCLLSGSDDQHLAVTDPYTGRILHKIRSGHRSNIFSAKFLPGSIDRETVSCAGDGKIFYTDISREDTYGTFMFDCHFGTTYEVIVIPNEASTFLSCGEDGTVRFFDLRAKTTCAKSDCKDDVLINCRSAVTSLAANPMLPWQLAIGCSDSSVRIYDRRMLGTKATGNYMGKGIVGLMSSFTPSSLEKQSYRITSLNYSPDGEDVLVSYSSEYIYLFGTKIAGEPKVFEKEAGPTEDDRAPNISSQQSSSEGQQAPSGSQEEASNDGSRQPPVKRLRLRGDWSDTGPGARPERERREDISSSNSSEQPTGGNPPRSTIMQRMSDLLTRWLDGNMRQNQQDDSSAPSDQNPAGELPTLPHSDDESTGVIPGISRGTEAQAMETAESREIRIAARSLEVPGTFRQQQTEGRGVSESVSGHAAVVKPRGRDSTDSRSDESQASFVQKIENMDMDDADSACQDIAGAVAESDAGRLEKTTDAKTDELSHDSEAMLVDSSDVDFTVLETEQKNVCTEDKLAESCDKPVDCDTEMYDPMHPTSYFDQRSCNSGTCEIADDSVKKVSALTDLPEDMGNVLHKPEAGKGAESQNNGAEAKDLSADTGQGTAVADGTDTTVEDERALVRESMNAAVETLRSKNVEPVISLHYSSEGTSNSIIKLGFTNFQSLEDEISEARNGRGIGQDHSVADNDSAANGRENHEATVGNVGSTEGAEQIKEIEKDKGHVEESMFYSEPEVTKSLSDSCTVKSSSDSDTLTGEGSSVTVVEDQICAIETEKSASHIDKSDEEQTLPEHMARTLPENVSKACDNDSENISLDQSSARSDIQESADHNLAEKAEAVEQSSGGITSMQEPVKVVITSGPEDMNVDEQPSTSAQEPSTADRRRDRRRRIGYSGPPTGDFQLPNPGEDNTSSSSSSASTSSSSDEEEVEVEEGNESGTRRPRVQLDRTSAALRLQALHRKRQKAKEEKEMEMKNVHRPLVRKKYKGHRNARTMIKEANFWGNNFVMSGSDCGHIFIWDRESTMPVMLLEADKHVVNCIQPHPYDTLLASSGIDYDIKIWAPLNDKPYYDERRAEEVMIRNEIMLVETRDTITVPAAFMLRVLASINSIRSGRRASSAARSREEANQGSDTD